MKRAAASEARRGFAVVAVLLLLLGLTALAHGALLLATGERIASALEARLVSRRIASVAAARPPGGPDTLPSLETGPRTLAGGSLPPLRWRTDAMALGPEFVLLSGVAAVEGVPGEARAGTLVWRLDPSARVAAAAAVVEAGGGVSAPEGSIRAERWLSPSPSDPRCAAELHALRVLGAAMLPPSASSVPSVSVDGGSPLPSLGLLGGDSLLARVPGGRLSGVITPHPETSGGDCGKRGSNWGSPSDPTGPCGSREVVVAAEGDLEVRGGEGQGVLLVAGALRLTDGAFYSGLVLVGGDLGIEGGATLSGMAIVRGRARLEAGARIEGSACAAARALRTAPFLRWPMRVPDGRIGSL